MNDNKQKKRGLLLVLPVLAFPFLSMAFWALGGGKGKRQDSTKNEGLNAALPAARPPGDSALDKMGFYDEAEKKEKGLGKDSSHTDSSALRNPDLEEGLLNSSAAMPYTGYSGSGYKSGSSNRVTGSQEERVQAQLRQLQAQLTYQESGYNAGPGSSPVTGGITGYPNSQYGSTQSITGTEKVDPEMQQLETMMNRIYDIQHPEEVANRLQAQSEANRGIVYPVETLPPQSTVHLLGKERPSIDSIATDEKAGQGFYGMASRYKAAAKPDRGLEAVIQENQTVVNGASVRMRLLEDVFINGLRIPKGTFISGTVQLSNDRLLVTTNTILYEQSVLPVQLSAYDTDGMEGLYAPGSIRSEVLQQSGDNVLQSTGIGTLNPSLGAQAAAAGIETAKTLFSRKLKLVKVFIKAGHRVILKNQHSTI